MKPVTLIAAAAVLLMNLISFFLMAHDKRQARRNGRRVSEKTLFLAAGLFGAFGGTLGMFLFRHKTKHWYFVWGFALLAIVDIAAVVYLLWVVLR